MTDKKIAFFSSARLWGGGEKWHLEMALWFKQHGASVWLFCVKQSPLYLKASATGLNVVCIQGGHLAFLNPFKRKRVANLFATYQIDIVIFNLPDDVKLGGLAAKKAGLQKIIYARGLAVPVKNSVLNRYLFGQVLTHVIANSQETKRAILANNPNLVQADLLRVIYHGINLPDFNKISPIVDSDLAHSKLHIGNLGRLTPQKGQHLLVDLAVILKNRGLKFTISIAGEGEEREALENYIALKKVSDCVVLLGYLDPVYPFLNSLDIFVLSSLWEGFGYVIAEAMAASKPVVAFDISSNPELIVHGETGFLATAGNVDELAQYIQQLSNDKELRVRMGVNGRKRVVENFDAQAKYTEFMDYVCS